MGRGKGYFLPGSLLLKWLQNPVHEAEVRSRELNPGLSHGLTVAEHQVREHRLLLPSVCLSGKLRLKAGQGLKPSSVVSGIGAWGSVLTTALKKRSHHSDLKFTSQWLPMHMSNLQSWLFPWSSDGYIYLNAIFMGIYKGCLNVICLC